MKKKKVRGFLAHSLCALFSLFFTLTSTPSFASEAPLQVEYGSARLNNYVGDALDFSNQSNFQYQIYFSGKNQIATTGEFGIRAKAETLIFTPLDSDASLEIIVNSSTATANGILNTTGSLELNENSKISISVSSSLPAATVSTSEVTAISVAQHLRAYPNVSLNLSNPTGNYAVFAQTYFLMGSEGADFFHATHKITNGVGDAFYNNDFEETSWVCTADGDCSRHVSVSMPDFTFSHLRSGTLGEFRFLTSIEKIAVLLDTSPINTQNLATPELFAVEEARLKNSLALSEASASQPISLDYEASRLIQDGDRLFFRLAVISTNPNYGFLHQDLGPYSHLFLNDNLEPFYAWDTNRLRPADGYHESFDIPLDTFTPAPAIEPKPEQPLIINPTELPEDPAPTVTILSPVVPKTPDTSAIPQTLRYSVFVIVLSGAFFLLAYTIFVVKLTYGQIIFSLWRHGLRQNHAASPSRFQLRRTRTSSLRHETQNRHQKRQKTPHAHRPRTRN